MPIHTSSRARWIVPVTRAIVLALVVGVLSGGALAATAGPNFSAWGPSQKIDEIAGTHPDLNTPLTDGCPIQSPNGLRLYMASNRPGGKGGLDIWVATRARTSDPWGAPVNLPEGLYFPRFGPENETYRTYPSSPTPFQRIRLPELYR